VTADAALDLDDQRIGPLLEGLPPRQLQEPALIGAGDEAETGGVLSGGNGGGL
jgi:hypothetical protein